MSKMYVIEIDDEHPFVRRYDHTNEPVKLYPAVGFNALVFDDVGLQKLTPYEKQIENDFIAMADAYLRIEHEQEEADGQRIDKNS